MLHLLRLMRTSRVCGVVLLTLLAGCGTVPFDFPKGDSRALVPSDTTRLGQAVAERSKGRANESGFYALTDGLEALGARLRLIEHADHTIDAQYFIFKGDLAGSLFAGKLLRAADRGVRVRFLIDDIYISGLDPELALLNSHPNIEIRLFNPISRQGVWLFNFLGDFRRANRRMHNKSFTVDNVVTIVGSRNIADEYFQIRSDIEFADFDVIGIGPVASMVSETFELFWNSDRAVPMEAFGKKVDVADLDEIRRHMAQDIERAEDSVYGRAVNRPFIDDLVQEKIAPVVASTKVVTDRPDKIENPIGAGQHQALASELRRVVSEAEHEVIFLTPYFVPRNRGVAFLRDIRSKGVRVVVITNSLASTNVIAVHSGYAPYRKVLLEEGVELYEVKTDAAVANGTAEPGAPDRLTLHTKAVVIDRQLLFVGSLNLDPRSIDINTEMGLFLDSADIATQFAQQVEDDLPLFTYRLVLSDNSPDHSPLEWHYAGKSEVSIEKWEPEAGFWRNFKADLFRLLPLEDQL